MHCVLCLMSRLSIQEIKVRHASMVQMLSYVETVNTLRSKHTEQCIVCCVSCQDCRYKRSKQVMLQWFKYYVMLCQYCRYKHVHTFLSITLLIFNGFSIQKKFWTAENQSFLTIPNIHACRYCRYRHKICNALNVDTVDTNMYTHFLSITLLIFNGFSIRKKFWTAENQSFLTIPNIHACRYCRYRHKISSAFNAMDVDTVDTQWFELHCVS